jgi:hypothetical protein
LGNCHYGAWINFLTLTSHGGDIYMAVLTVQPLAVGINGSIPTTQTSQTPQPSSLIFINTNDTSATVTATGYLNASKSLYGNMYMNGQLAVVYTSDHGQSAYQIQISGSDISLVPEVNPGSVVLPVVSGNFVNFDGTTGILEDAGYSPSDATKTKVVMATAATTADLIPKFTDIAGTIGDGYTPSDTAKTVAVMADAATTVDLIPKFTDIAGTIGDGYTPSDDAQTIVSMVDGATIAGNFAVYSDITGTTEDLTYSPSDASKTKVVMASAAVIANHIACFSDTAGTVNDDAATAINAGNIQAGLPGTAAGANVSCPAGAGVGTFITQATANSGAFNTVLTNNALGQTTTFHLPDPGAASAGILVSTLTAPDNNANLIRFDVTVTAAALAAGGSVTLYASSGAKQYKIVNLWVNAGGTNFSGVGGDRLISVTDNTTSYTDITSALLISLLNADWGSATVPFPTGVALTTSTVAGQALVAKYSGGTGDYGAGSVVISGLLQRVA